MKKVLLTTSALAFAGSAFAAEVSGYVVSAYSKDKDGAKTLYSETEVYVSGSKTASNGLTFGATYTIGQDGNNEATTKTDSYNNINSFVSGSFGRVDTGYHSSAPKALGAASISVGNGTVATSHPVTRVSEKSAVTYTSPKFNGVQAAYTKVLGADQAKSWAINWSGKVSGVGVAVAYGKHKSGGGANSNDTAYGVKVSKGAFSASYTIGKEASTTAAIPGATALQSGGLANPIEGSSKSKRIGVAYTAGKVTVGYSRNKTTRTGKYHASLAGSTATGASKTTVFAVSYKVASGLTVFAEQGKTGADKTTYIGTNISF